MPRVRWCARIKYEGKDMHLGTYETQEEAAKAYDAAAIRYRGAKTKTNFGQNRGRAPRKNDAGNGHDNGQDDTAHHGGKGGDRANYGIHDADESDDGEEWTSVWKGGVTMMAKGTVIPRLPLGPPDETRHAAAHKRKRKENRKQGEKQGEAQWKRKRNQERAVLRNAAQALMSVRALMAKRRNTDG